MLQIFVDRTSGLLDLLVLNPPLLFWNSPVRIRVYNTERANAQILAQTVRQHTLLAAPVQLSSWQERQAGTESIT